MIGYHIKCKDIFSYRNNSLLNAFDAIQLKESHDAGEIINNHWLICNNEVMSDMLYLEPKFCIPFCS